jgi:hypothetical protein
LRDRLALRKVRAVDAAIRGCRRRTRAPLSPDRICGHDGGVRAKVLAVVAVVGLAAATVVVATAATTARTANGLPSYTDGYLKWPKINAKPIRNQDPRSGHAGVKNVYRSKAKRGKAFPNGTVIVKTIVEPPSKFVAKVAVMRKVGGKWRWVEYTRTGPSTRYTVLAQGQLCVDCHMQVRTNDWVFTKR